MSGLGLSASVKGQEVLVGRLSFLKQEDVKMPAKFRQGSVRQSVVYVAADGKLAGAITLKDELRPETAETLQRLGSWVSKKL